MVVRAYAVLTLPAKDTVLGALSERGCRIELVAVPRRHDALGSCYAVHFTVEGVPSDEAEKAEARLRAVFACITSSEVDAGSHAWTASGWIPVQNIAVRVFRLLERPPGAMAAPWLVMHNGVAQVRLRPEQGGMDGFLQRLADTLQGHGVSLDVMVAELDDEAYVARLAGLDDMPEPVLA